MTVRWTFYDPSTSTTATFPVNPNEGGTPQLKKQVSTKQTTASSGRVMFEGNSVPNVLSWSGVLLEQAQYVMFQTWSAKRHQVLLTDDRGREYYIYITSFSAERQRAQHSPWKHTYTMSASILDWPLEYHPTLYAAAGVATGTGTVYLANDFTRPSAATGTGRAYGPFILIYFDTPGGAASSTGTAFNATVVVS